MGRAAPKVCGIRGVEPLGERAGQLLERDCAGAVGVALVEELIDVVVVEVAVAVLW